MFKALKQLVPQPVLNVVFFIRIKIALRKATGVKKIVTKDGDTYPYVRVDSHNLRGVTINAKTGAFKQNGSHEFQAKFIPYSNIKLLEGNEHA